MSEPVRVAHCYLDDDKSAAAEIDVSLLHGDSAELIGDGRESFENATSTRDRFISMSQ